MEYQRTGPGINSPTPQIIKLSDYIPHNENCGKCFFCISTCPECGSNNVEIECTVTRKYDNADGTDKIGIVTGEINIKLECSDCGETFVTGF